MTIDKQALRDIAEKTKIAGEAPVMPFEQRINALNDFMKHFTPATALALLDELEAAEKRIGEMDVYRARRVFACIAACEGISTENLVNNVPIKQGLRGLNARIREADGELEALRQRIADQQGIILSARQFISEYAASGDAGADEFVKVIDRAAGIGKGE
ncbi:ead/Ea22-like family protein [Citrobacter koseri]|uniref:ead/Ea22-like family protein n=1 Tax=Citrobacter koseri TaxID=545 RepID=UPI0023AAFDEF|nr:ead/Ea22-like family protein [Citrobacter koseri]WEE18632.1 ead/Ea22-like family protein [Citrobacter koseri]